MTKVKWRDLLPPELTQEMDETLRRIKPYSKAYLKSQSKANAQIWTALVLLSKNLKDVKERLDSIEKRLFEKEPKISEGVLSALEKL